MYICSLSGRTLYCLRLNAIEFLKFSREQRDIGPLCCEIRYIIQNVKNERRLSRSVSGRMQAGRFLSVRTYVHTCKRNLFARKCTINYYLKYIEERSSNYAQGRDYYKESTRHATLLVLHMWFVKKYFGSRKLSLVDRHLYLHLAAHARNHDSNSFSYVSGNENIWNLWLKAAQKCDEDPRTKHMHDVLERMLQRLSVGISPMIFSTFTVRSQACLFHSI